MLKQYLNIMPHQPICGYGRFIYDEREWGVLWDKKQVWSP